MLAGMGMSLRKRWRRLKWGHYAWWVITHVIGGMLVLILLLLHTGLSLGQSFNQWFLVVFLGILAMGALVGIFTVLENRHPHVLNHRIKTALKRLHLSLSWPVPALLIMHLLAVYYF